jgi:peptidoglycan hydrolase-like protein with peptidoglycan-binding domain
VPVLPGIFLDNASRGEFHPIVIWGDIRRWAKEAERMGLYGSWLKSRVTASSAAVLVCSIACVQAVALPAASATKTTTSATKPATKLKSTKAKRSKTSTSSKGKHSRKGSRRGQQKIDLERTHQIQQALIQKHYLSGEPSGKWDASTEAALRKFQADNGWQNKTVPDSRALIKLGLGPNHDHLLNPESAMTTTPETSAASEASTPPAKGPAVPVSQPQR